MSIVALQQSCSGNQHNWPEVEARNGGVVNLLYMLVSLGTQTRMYTAAQSKETPMEHASCFHMQELLSLSLIRAPQRTNQTLHREK